VASIYINLTREFNRDGLRCIVSSGQVAVLHQLAMMSKDGDWIVREDAVALGHVLQVLEEHGARYRLGAPLDARWMAGGWSAHFEFVHRADPSSVAPLRIRTDFVSRPPRLSVFEIEQLWREQEERAGNPEAVPVVDLARLARLKQTDRERDYAVIGELARRMEPRDQMLFGRSARDLLELAAQHPVLAQELAQQRSVLHSLGAGRDALEAALDAERRTLMRAHEERLAAYVAAARPWYAAWPALERRIAGWPLRQTHAEMARAARGVLPEQVLVAVSGVGNGEVN